MRIYHKTKKDYTDYTKKLRSWADSHGMKYAEYQLNGRVYLRKSKDSR